MLTPSTREAEMEEPLVKSYRVDSELVRVGLEMCPMPAGVSLSVWPRSGGRYQVVLTCNALWRDRTRMRQLWLGEVGAGTWMRLKGEAVELLMEVWRGERKAAWEAEHVREMTWQDLERRE